MRRMGIRGIFPRRSVTKSVKTGVIDLVKNKKVTKPNQVWATDITYVRVKDGYSYEVFIMNIQGE